MPLDFLAVGASPVAGYELLQPLGGTAFSSMWSVKAPDGSTRVWKVVDLAVGNAALETRNLELLVRLKHPALNPLLEYHTLPAYKALILETAPPVKSLRDRLKECQRSGGKGVPLYELTGWMRSVAEGLDFLNAPQHDFQGKKVAIYHRELRPENMLLFREGGAIVCKVGDFGLAKPVEDQSNQHSQGLTNYDYDPPEFYEGTTSRSCDQYSLAIVCCELRNGVLPFRGSILQQLTARLNNAPDLSAIESDGERMALSRALQKDPQKRFGSCGEFVAEWLLAVSAADAKGVPESPSVRLRRSPVRPKSPAPEMKRTPPPAPTLRNGRLSLPEPVQLVEHPTDGGSSVRLVRRKAEEPAVEAISANFPDSGPNLPTTEARNERDLSRDVARTPSRADASSRSRRDNGPTTTIRPAPAEDKIPMVWVYIISTIVLSAVALIAKEVVTNVHG